MMDFHVHVEFFNKDDKETPTYQLDVVIPTEELPNYLLHIGTTTSDPNCEFEVGDEVVIIYHLTGLCEQDD